MMINGVFHLIEQIVIVASSLDETFAMSWSPTKKPVLEQIHDVSIAATRLIHSKFCFTEWFIAKIVAVEIQFCTTEREGHDCEIEPERFRPGTACHNACR